MKLTILSDISEIIAGFYDAEGKENIDSITLELKEPKAAVGELITLAKSAAKELRSSMLAAKKALEQDVGTKASRAATAVQAKATGASAGARPAQHLLEVIPESCTPMPTFATLEVFQAQPPDVGCPFIISLGRDNPILLDNPTNPIMQMMSLFVADYESHSLRLQMGPRSRAVVVVVTCSLVMCSGSARAVVVVVVVMCSRSRAVVVVVMCLLLSAPDYQACSLLVS
jgi:hypothetical protein